MNSRRNNIDTTELLISNEKLKVEVKTLEFKLEQANEITRSLRQRCEELKTEDAERLREENIRLNDEIKNLKFSAENDTSLIELKTENAKLKSELEVQQQELEHLKKLLETYRAMPDVNNMINNLSTLAVPSIDKLKEFINIIDDSKIGTLCELLQGTINAITYDRPYYGKTFR